MDQIRITLFGWRFQIYLTNIRFMQQRTWFPSRSWYWRQWRHILDISRREKDPQQHNNTLEQISHWHLFLVLDQKFTPTETNGNLSVGMLWCLCLPYCKQRRQVVYRKALLSRIKVKRDMSSWISQIKHIDNGSNDNVFWQIFEELQNQSTDKKTVNGHKLKTRLVSTNKFFVGVKL
jgi:hypothetical protein